ncbi:MAG: hypothetical protein PHV34_08860 [Verrucomicrobiae bacterium]|nr:hypothetical protein [Verrucomicrobiae bacterium]
MKKLLIASALVVAVAGTSLAGGNAPTKGGSKGFRGKVIYVPPSKPAPRLPAKPAPKPPVRRA